jgi:hypothetical protein
MNIFVFFSIIGISVEYGAVYTYPPPLKRSLKGPCKANLPEVCVKTH